MIINSNRKLKFTLKYASLIFEKIDPFLVKSSKFIFKVTLLSCFGFGIALSLYTAIYFT